MVALMPQAKSLGEFQERFLPIRSQHHYQVGGKKIMNSYSDSAGSLPVDENPIGLSSTWDWLSDRVNNLESNSLGNWLEDQLDDLEQQFSEYVTPKSRSKEICSGR